MGIISTLKGSNIRFNPKPWLNEQSSVKEVQFKSVENTTMIEDKNFIDLHLKVAEKVDALIEEMESEGRFDNWDEPKTDLSPESKTDLDKTVLRS